MAIRAAKLLGMNDSQRETGQAEPQRRRRRRSRRRKGAPGTAASGDGANGTGQQNNSPKSQQKKNPDSRNNQSAPKSPQSQAAGTKSVGEGTGTSGSKNSDGNAGGGSSTSGSSRRRRRRRQGPKQNAGAQNNNKEKQTSHESGTDKQSGQGSNKNQKQGAKQGQKQGNRNRRGRGKGQQNRPNRRAPQRQPQKSQMRTSVETSAGGLVVSGLPEAVRPDGTVDMSRIYVALIGRLDRRGRLLWSMPKGHVEPGEQHDSTAEREVWEETGIHGGVITDLGVIDYWFVSDGVRIHKTVYHHLLRYLDGDLNDEDPEVTEVQWVPVVGLVERLAYADERKLARRAHDLLPELARAEYEAGRRTPR